MADSCTTPDESSNSAASRTVGDPLAEQRRDHGTESVFDDRFPQLLELARNAAARILGRDPSVDDVAQSTLVRAYTHWPEIEEYAEPWVIRVATNRAIDTWRQRTRRREVPLTPNLVGSDQPVAETSPEVLAAVRALSPHRHDALMLRAVHGYTVDEVASRLGTSRSAVLKNTMRARAQLRVLLASAS